MGFSLHGYSTQIKWKNRDGMMRLKREMLVKVSRGFLFFLQLGLRIDEFSTVYLIMRREPMYKRGADRLHPTNLPVLKHEVVLDRGKAGELAVCSGQVQYMLRYGWAV